MRHVLGVAKVLVLSAVICAFSGSAKAQDDSKDLSPQEVYQLAGEAMKALDYEKFTSYVHPEALADFKDMLWPVLELEAKELDSFAFSGNAQSLGLKFDDNGLVPMTPSELFTSVLKSLERLAPGFEKAFAEMQEELIGEVKEGDTLVHIVSRVHFSIGTLSTTLMQVSSLKRSENGWKMILSGEFKGLAESLSQQLSR